MLSVTRTVGVAQLLIHADSVDCLFQPLGGCKQAVTLIMPADYKCPPVQKRAEGHHSDGTIRGDDPLLLVVHCGAFVFLALCIGSIDCDRAALAVGCDHNVGRQNNLTAFF
jgi:hypothetical protein